MVVFSVLYPAAEGERFDAAYYDASHIPLVKSAFADTGLVSVQVFHGQAAGDGAPAPFVAMAHLTFSGPDALRASLTGPRSGEVSGDLVNFTTITPITQVSALGA